MSHQSIKSDLLVELSTDQQQLMSGGQRYPVICYDYEPYFRGGRGGRGGRGDDYDFNFYGGEGGRGGRGRGWR